jgi:hypothetical protein
VRVGLWVWITFGNWKAFWGGDLSRVDGVMISMGIGYWDGLYSIAWIAEMHLRFPSSW